MLKVPSFLGKQCPCKRSSAMCNETKGRNDALSENSYCAVGIYIPEGGERQFSAGQCVAMIKTTLIADKYLFIS